MHRPYRRRGRHRPYRGARGRQNNSRDGEASHQERGRRPPGLRGREIGLWYARQNAARNKVSEKTNISSVEMNQSQLHSVQNAISAAQSSEVDDSPSFGAGPSRRPISNRVQTYQWFVETSCHSETNENLRQNLKEKISGSCSSSFNKLLQFRKKLPAYKMKKELIEVVNSNQVVVISGETGCGKTTQVPQFILDDAIAQGKGLSCKVVCTQPRRISAISVAERVANERDEKCGEGNSCGYQIRLQSRFPRAQASILYCTTGIITQWLQSDPHLSNVSHIVLDEIHERDLQCDFLIAILKDIIKIRKDLKVILMSATLNADYFSDYFDKCPKINIPGFTFPVTKFNLEETLNMIQYEPSRFAYKEFNKVMSNKIKGRVGKEEHLAKQKQLFSYSRELRDYEKQLRFSEKFPEHIAHAICCMDVFLQKDFDFDFIVELIKFIVKNPLEPNCKNGAILVFLPGWEQIKKLNNLITKNQFFQPEKYLVIPLHSMMPTVNQQQVFSRPPPGVTKIVIATNIAETSITIDDVVYVIDSGKIKVKNFEHDKNINILQADWVSKANARQRSGRAGRVQAGYCFHLFSKLQESKMAEYMTPEILRTPLDQVCLQIKRLKFGKVQTFLSLLLDPPAEESVALSVQKLLALNALDEDENLTSLGHHLSELPLEPQIGKMLLFGAIFSCLDPVLTIAACLTHKDPFVVPLGKEYEVDKQRKLFSKGLNSDHLMYVNLFNEWQKASRFGYSAAKNFCHDHFLSSSTLKMLKDMRDQFSRNLENAGFLNTKDGMFESVNEHSENMNVILAVVCSGLYPNVAKLRKGFPDRPPKICTNTEWKVSLHPKSVNVGKPSSKYEHQWLCYNEKMRTSEVYLYDTSEISPFPLLFFGGAIKTFVKEETEMVSVDDWITFKAKIDVANTVKTLRYELDKLLELKIKRPQWQTNDAQKLIVYSIIELISRS